jgi:lysophospholipase L1-like esterase
LNKPKVLLAGDSISFGYGPGAIELLKSGFEAENLPGNGSTSANLLSHMEDWILGPGYDIIHFNCGLHDIAVERGKDCTRIPLDSYEANLRKILDRVQGEVSKLSWASTTPVIYIRHHSEKPFERREKDVLAYNRVAARVMMERGVPIDDLHGVVERAGRERCVGEDGVHMTDLGNDVLSKAVATFIRDL